MRGQGRTDGAFDRRVDARADRVRVALARQEDRGVLRFGDEAPEGASIALIGYEGQEYRVPVRHGHFLFVAWDAPSDERPSLIGFE